MNMQELAEILQTGLQGAHEGFVSGLESFADGLAFGNMDDEKSQARREHLQALAERMNLGTANQMAHQALKKTGSAISAYLLWRGLNPFATAAIGSAIHYKGRRELLKQLQKGANFKDIHYGRINNRKLDDINYQRFMDNQELINSNNILIPSGNVKHIYEKRIIGNKYTPERVVENLDNALFKPAEVYRGKPETHQLLIHKNGRGGNMAVVDKKLRGDGISVITTLKRRNINNLESRQNLSSVPNTKYPTGDKHFTHQIVYPFIISPDDAKIKSLVDYLNKIAVKKEKELKQ